ncbi:hypothetical protein ACFL0I_00220 [Gemmatimonadota bacterium]
MRHPHIPTGVLALALLALPPLEQGVAQTLTVTPTYQASVSRYDSNVPGSEFSAYGLMLGLIRPGAWWAPHFWYQRYRTDSRQRYAPDFGFPSGGDGTENTGWMLSVGPAIEYSRREPWTVTFMPQLSLTPQAERRLNGGAGVHVGFRAGLFQPQVFGRFQTLGPNVFWTVGAGVTLELTWIKP